jgi:ribosomal protein S18 acetylase RimI-like enzyme
MVADRLLPPRRPLAELEFRPVNDAETRRAYCEVNAAAYADPIDLVIQALGGEALWDRTFGFVGYAGGEPVTTANTIVMGETLYMSLVATRPEQQEKGYAEAVMRHSLARAREATGLERTVLHATPAGRPLYLDMGYRPVAEFLGYAAGGGH